MTWQTRRIGPNTAVMSKHVALALMIALGLPAAAPAGSWDEDIVRIEVLDGGAVADGTHRAGLRLQLADGWKTYWRAPGDAGIPPRFDWSGSRNLGAVELHWPAPIVFFENGMRSIGYSQEVVLPLDLKPRSAGRAIRLKGKIEIGVCREVCIPATLHVDTDLNPQAGVNAQIVAARASRPQTAAEAGVGRVVCRLSPIEDGLRIEARIDLPQGRGSEVAVVEPGDPAIWASEPAVTRTGGTLVAVADLIHVDGGAFALDRSQMRFTVIDAGRAVDIRGCAAD